MLKTCFFILLVMLMRPAASDSIMSHEKFVHLDYEEQKQIVIATMELVVEIESKYQREVKTSGFNLERFRRYSEFMKSVSSLMFPEAHAAIGRNQTFGKYLNQLTLILSDKQKDRCIYGGWISEMRGNKCTHPRNSKEFSKLYQPQPDCLSGNNKITCNPAIFGFKNVDPTKRTLFCVDAGPNGADNTSRDCMAKALAEKPENEASSSKERIDHIIAGIAERTEDAKNVFNFLIKACACDASKSPQISKLYSDYMRPHQTCYSILKMLSEFTPKCEADKKPLLGSNQTLFLKSIHGILEANEYNSSNVKELYTAKLTELRKKPEFKASETEVCGGDPAVPVIVGDGTETETCVENKSPKGDFCCPKGLVPFKDKGKDSCKAPDDSKITVGEPDPQIKPDEKPVPDPNLIPDPATGGGTSTETKTCDNGATDHPKCETCPPGKKLNADKTKCEEAPAVTAEACTNGATDHPKCETCSPGKKLNADKTKCEEAPAVTAEACTNGATDHPKCETCAETQEFNDENMCVDKTPTPKKIIITKKEKDVNVTIVTASISPDKTPKDGYTVKWFSRGTSRPRKIPGSKPKTEPTTVPLTEDLPEKPEKEGDAPGAEKPEPKPDTSGKPEENESDLEIDGWGPINAPRQSNDYEMCARLIKDAEIVDRKCEKIPAKPGIAPLRNGPGQFGPQQFGPTRGGPSDAIYRGIR